MAKGRRTDNTMAKRRRTVERTWWSIFQKRVLRTESDNYVYCNHISSTARIRTLEKLLWACLIWFFLLFSFILLDHSSQQVTIDCNIIYEFCCTTCHDNLAYKKRFLSATFLSGYYKYSQ
jgi:hypothetical protein